MLGKLIAGLVGGVLVAAFAVPLTGIIAARTGASVDHLVPILILIVVASAIGVAVISQRPAKAWRYLLICAGSLSLILSLIHIGLLDNTTFTSAGLVSFIAGVILLLVGLLVGRDIHLKSPPVTLNKRQNKTKNP